MIPNPYQSNLEQIAVQMTNAYPNGFAQFGNMTNAYPIGNMGSIAALGSLTPQGQARREEPNKKLLLLEDE